MFPITECSLLYVRANSKIIATIPKIIQFSLYVVVVDTFFGRLKKLEQRKKLISAMASSVNSGNEVLDKKIDQWLEWDKVRLNGEPG